MLANIVVGDEEGGRDVLITPRIRGVMRSTRELVVFLDLTSTAVLSTTVSMAWRPAAFMVSPDSISSVFA